MSTPCSPHLSAYAKHHSRLFALSSCFVHGLLSSALILILLLATFLPLPLAAVDTPFTVAIPEDIVSLDPATVTDGASLLIATQIYDTLVYFDPDTMLPTPALAWRWTVSPDKLTWTFHLRSGLTFHDGSPLTAADVVFNINRWWDPAHPNHQGDFPYFAALFGGFKGDANCRIVNVQATDALKVAITLKGVDPSFLSKIGFASFSIAKPAAIQAGTLGTNPVGSGSFRFVQRIVGDRIRLAANEQSWRGAPRSSSLVFRVIPQESDRIAALQSGAVQDAWSTAGPENDPELDLMIVKRLSFGYLGINRDRDPLGSQLVRQAIAHAVDKEHLLSAGYSPQTQTAPQFLPGGLWGSDPTIVDYDYNPTLAKSLLAQAGFPTGITTTLSYRTVVRGYLPNPSAAAQLLKEDMATAGIQVVINEFTPDEFFEKLNNGELDLFLLGWSADYPHPDNFFGPHFCPPMGLGAQDNELCAQLAAARGLTDLLAQEVVYKWASRRVHTTVPMVPLINVATAQTKRYDVAGVVAAPIGTDYHDAHVVGADNALVTPQSGGALAFDDANSQPTEVQVPPGALAQPATLTLVETTNNAGPTGFRLAGHAFEINAFVGGVPAPDFAFSKPVTVTIEYSDAELAGVWEDTLALYYQDGNDWVDAADSCSPPSVYTHDETNNVISVPICHLSTFALNGERWPTEWLPFLSR